MNKICNGLSDSKDRWVSQSISCHSALCGRGTVVSIVSSRCTYGCPETTASHGKINIDKIPMATPIFDDGHTNGTVGETV